ncbi:MAG: hypothetical protein H6710_08430 [Myxococcales bacterium]|nr:hypothetical protein [Myxococcales bacterium]MCB9704272.1 hypothetical protein [Myxococcales bacterium]
MDPAILFWDFFGPDAAGTAEHFQRHLAELLTREGIAGCELGQESAGPGHAAITCRAPLAVTDDLVARLRPRRIRRPAAPVE